LRSEVEALLELSFKESGSPLPSSVGNAELDPSKALPPKLPLIELLLRKGITEEPPLKELAGAWLAGLVESVWRFWVKLNAAVPAIPITARLTSNCRCFTSLMIWLALLMISLLLIVLSVKGTRIKSIHPRL